MTRRGERSLAHALLALLALPGVVAFGIPLAWLRPRSAGWRLAPEGAVLVVVGAAILLWCVRAFYVSGRGTLAPWAPPSHLVTEGLYRYSRNPMYVGVLCILAGWALGFRSPALGLYAAVIGVMFHLRILLHEEPFLARTHGAEWLAYAARTPRWLLLRRSANLVA